MATNFMSLKRGGQTQLDTYNKKVQELNSGGFAKDERYWFPVQDKAGVGSAVIRFLPPSDGEEVPFVRLFHYGIKGIGWYIENSRATLKLPDPASDLYFQYKNEGNEAMATKLSRRMSFISNIYVVKHTARPEDEGKTFLFKYGKKIFDKLQDKMTPPEDMPSMDPFNLWTGANFWLRIRKVQDFNNYDQSEFHAPVPLLDDDSAMEAIWNGQYKLAPEIAPDKFKTYEELQTKLYTVLGLSGAPTSSVTDKPRESAPKATATSDPKPRNETGPSEADSDDLSFFKRLASKKPKAAVDDDIPF